MCNCSEGTLKVAYINHPFFIISNDSGHNPSGFDYWLLEILSHHLNFKFELVTPSDGLWGAKIGFNQWSGMVGLLQTKEADFAISSMSMTTSRQAVVDFSQPYSYDAVTFLTKSRKAPIARKVFFFLPFSLGVWFLIASAYVLCATTLLLFQKVYKTSIFPPQWKRNIRPWIIFQVLARQDLDLKKIPSSKTISSRFLLGGWLVSVVVLVQYYCGMLTSTVSVARTMPSIDTVNDLAEAVKMGIFQIGMLKGNAFEDMILEATREPMLVFKNSISKSDFHYPKDEYFALNRVAYGDNFAYFEQKRSLERLIEEINVSDEVHFPKEDFFVDLLAIAFRKDFNKDCLSAINTVLKRMLSTGLLQKLNRGNINNAGLSGKIDTQNYIDLSDVQSVFLACCIGYDLALLVLITEILYQHLYLSW